MVDFCVWVFVFYSFHDIWYVPIFAVYELVVGVQLYDPCRTDIEVSHDVPFQSIETIVVCF